MTFNDLEDLLVVEGYEVTISTESDDIYIRDRRDKNKLICVFGGDKFSNTWFTNKGIRNWFKRRTSRYKYLENIVDKYLMTDPEKRGISGLFYVQLKPNSVFMELFNLSVGEDEDDINFLTYNVFMRRYYLGNSDSALKHQTLYTFEEIEELKDKFKYLTDFHIIREEDL